MPDDELFSLAATGELLQPSVLRAQVKRMRKDPRFQRFATRFSSQWLGLSAMENVAVNPTVHREFSDEITENLKRETLAFASHVLTNDLSCRNFLQSDFAMLNQTVAKHYGIEGVHGSHFRPVPLRPEDRRGGVLTQGSFLIAGSDGTDSNPIYRGVWLKKRLFADPPPPPPPGVPALDDSPSRAAKLSLKQQIALHRQAPACARCHNKIDPWGVAFENYDAVGLWRTRMTKSTGEAVDAQSTLPDGETVDGVAELQDYLMKNKSDDLAEALARRMLGYALGRRLGFSDDETTRELSQAFQASDYQVSALLEKIVTSQAFLSK
ncbi:MAG: DUF1592 domain-containing protein, partial [Planctomycetales bacterium]